MIKSIKLSNFRLFDELYLDTNNSLVIISGKNATGKTSVLESIYLCSTSKSHRTMDLSSVISKQKEYTVCEIETSKTYKVVLSHQGKSFYINKKEMNKVSEYIGDLSVVLFSPYDLNLVLGTKGERRRFLDLEISLLDKGYLKTSSLYKKILKERNDVLKSPNIDSMYLDIITHQLADACDIIYQKRMGFIEEINRYLKNISSEMGIEPIEIRYRKTYEKDVYASFKGKEKQDILTKVTNIGTHRDDFEVYIQDLDAKVYASEGQIRTICIAIKMALKEYIKKIKGKEPILLLDDVFAALDKSRIEQLTKYVQKNRQTFITTTSILEIPDALLKNALVLRIEKSKEIKDGK